MKKQAIKNHGILIPIKKLKIENRPTRDYVAKLQYLALRDPLTKLPNRNLFMDRLTTAIKKAKRYEQKFAIMFLDLDEFKSINDTYGHGIGDKVLQHTAEIIQDSIRDSDTSARLGGDEFTVLIEELTNTKAVNRIAQTIINKLKIPFRTGYKIINFSGSIGIAEYPKDATDEMVLNFADYALSEAKRMGRGNYKWYQSAQ